MSKEIILKQYLNLRGMQLFRACITEVNACSPKSLTATTLNTRTKEAAALCMAVCLVSTAPEWVWKACWLRAGARGQHVCARCHLQSLLTFQSPRNIDPVALITASKFNRFECDLLLSFQGIQ